MAVFQYITILPSGKQKKSLIEAETERQARKKIKDSGGVLISIKAYHETKATKYLDKIQQYKYKINFAQLSLMTRQLASLLQSGIVLEEALQALIEQSEKAKVKAILLSIKAKILEGSSLAEALSQFPSSFSPLYRATVSAGERSGHLDVVLENLAEYIDKQKKLKQQIYQALLYPLLMTLVSSTIIIFLLTYVVPKMVSVFTQNKQHLPIATTILINISRFMQNFGIYLAIFIIAGLVAFIYSYNNKLIVKQKTQTFLLRLPLIKSMIKLVSTARFSRTIGILLKAGIPAEEAMRISGGVVSNVLIKKSIESARENVIEGGGIYKSLKQTKYFPAMSLHLINSGEKSGNLADMFLRAANNQEYDTEQFVKSILTLFEPILILIMGSIVLFIVLAVLLPIFTIDQMV